jgi:hypothetical protein
VLCSVYNGHSAAKLEKSILEYLGEFSNPIKVRQHLTTAERRDTEKYEVELKQVEKRLAELEAQFLAQLNGLLKRKVLTEQEFAKANEAARTLAEPCTCGIFNINRAEKLLEKIVSKKI